MGGLGDFLSQRGGCEIAIPCYTLGDIISCLLSVMKNFRGASLLYYSITFMSQTNTQRRGGGLSNFLIGSRPRGGGLCRFRVSQRRDRVTFSTGTINKFWTKCINFFFTQGRIDPPPNLIFWISPWNGRYNNLLGPSECTDAAKFANKGWNKVTKTQLSGDNLAALFHGLRTYGPEQTGSHDCGGPHYLQC